MNNIMRMFGADNSDKITKLEKDFASLRQSFRELIDINNQQNEKWAAQATKLNSDLQAITTSCEMINNKYNDLSLRFEEYKKSYKCDKAKK